MLANSKVLPSAPRTRTRLVGLGAAAVVVALAVAASLGSVPDAAGVTGKATVTINAVQQYQRIAGFGVSEGFGQARR